MSLKRDLDSNIEGDSKSIDSTSPFVCLPMFGEHKRAVSAVQLAPSRLTKHSSALCASASADGSVKIWDLIDPHSPISKDMKEKRGTHNIDDDYLLQPVTTLVGHSRGINDVCWSNGVDPFVATASDDKTVRIWDAQTADALVEFRGHDNFVFCCSFNQASNLLASGSFDETVKLWDVRSGTCVSTLPAHSDPVTAVSFNRDGTCVVSASHDGLIRVWDVATGECLKTIFAAGNPPVSHVTYSPNGKFVLAGTLDSALRLWPISVSGKSKCAKTYTSEYHTNTKYCIASRFLVSNPQRRQCIVTGSETGHVILYDVQSRKVHQLLEQVHKDAVLAVDAHDQMELLASGGMSKDRTVRFWMPKDDVESTKRPRSE
jgi:COMPASS component SWD3